MKSIHCLLASLIMLTLLTITQTTIAAPNSDILGRWESVTNYQGDVFPGTFEVKEENGVLTAAWVTRGMGTQINKVAYKSGTLTFSFYHPEGGLVNCKVKISGDSGTGESWGDWGTAPTTVKRANTASADAILGEWRVSTYIEGDAYGGNVVFSQEGGVLKGYWTQAKQNLKNVKFENGKLSFSLNHYEGGPTDITLTPEGDSMSGMSTGSFGRATVSASKVK